MHGSLIYAAKFVLPPNKQVWEQALRPYLTGNKPLLTDVLNPLQAQTQSEGLKILLHHANRYWNRQENRFDMVMEQALDELWSAYDASTKPDSTRFDDILQWLCDLGTDNTARKQFLKMGTHAIPYFEAAVILGAAHEPTAALQFLRGIQHPHAEALVSRLTESTER